MEDAQKLALVKKFKFYTCAVDDNYCVKYLVAAGWNLEKAVNSYCLDNNDGDVIPVVNEADKDISVQKATTGQRVETADPKSSPKHKNCDEDVEEQTESSSSSSDLHDSPEFSPTSRKYVPPGPRITTIKSFASESQDSNEEAFYAGGSVRSGQQIINPKSNTAQSIFESAKRHGAVMCHENELKLQASIDPILEQHSSIEVVLFKNGYSINQGEIFNYEDKENKEFLDAIRLGHKPDLIASTDVVHVILNDMPDVHEKPQKVIAFSGAGFRLGSPSGAPVSMASTSSVESEPDLELLAEAQNSLRVDYDKPIIVVQVRLLSSTRVKLVLNNSHKVSDIMKCLNVISPEYSKEQLELCVYPHIKLQDDDEVGELGIANSVLYVRKKAGQH